MKKSHLSGWIAALSLGVAGAAVAGSPAPQLGTVDVRAMPVSFVIDEAHTARGATQLFHRIRQAAAEVCRTSWWPAGHDRWMQHACEAEAVGEAVQALNIPALNAIYGRRTDVTLVASR